MYLKEKAYSLGVLLIYTITSSRLPPAGWCHPTAQPSLTDNVRSSVLTTDSPTTLPYSDTLQNGDGTATTSSGGRPEPRLRPRMASTGSRSRHRPRQTEEWGYSPSSSPHGNCSSGRIEQVVRGKFYIPGQLEPNMPNMAYQSDSAVSVQAQGGRASVRGQQVTGSEESWQKLQPVVVCGDHAMTLTVRKRRAVQLLLARANESSVPLSQLTPRCGYSVQTTWRDLSLIAQYDACHVTQEGDNYVLPLLWRGTPVKMSCPVSQIRPQAAGLSSLCCSPYGMTFKIQGLSASEEQRINVRGEWTPLALLAEQCGYTLDRQGAEIVIAVPFMSCGVTVKDGRYTLYLQIGKKVFALACPVSPLQQLPITPQPLVDGPPHLTRGATKPLLGSLEPFLWPQPFYLAPLYYPHPTHHHSNSGPYKPPTTPSVTHEPTSSSQILPPPADSQADYQDYYPHQRPQSGQYEHIHSALPSRDEMEDSSRLYPDQKQNQEAPVSDPSKKQSATPTGHLAQVEAPRLQPPSHNFNPYYRYYLYYHHPKIPFPGTPQHPDPGPEVSNTHSHEFPALPPNIQQSEGLSKVNSGQFPLPVPETTSQPYTLPTNPKLIPTVPALHAPYLPHPHPYYYFYYFPHIARGEAKRLVLLHPDVANMSHVHSLPHSAVPPVHDEHSVNPIIHEPNADETITTDRDSSDWIKHPFLSEDDVKSEVDGDKRRSASVTPAGQPPVPQSYPHGLDPVAVPLPEQPPLPPPAFVYNPNPYQYYYYHPFYDYYQLYYGSEGLLSADNHKTSNPLLQASSSPAQQTTTPPTESLYTIENGLLHPYYYYYHPYYKPEVSKDNQGLYPTGSVDSEPQLPSDSDYGRMAWFVHAAEAGYPSIPLPMHNSFHSLYNEMKDHLQAHTNTPSASPSLLGPVSDFDCSNSLGCCPYNGKDCTVGQYFAFAVPDSVVDPAVAPPAHSSEDGNVSCPLQRLTSDLDFYFVPLDGCGVNKHMFDQTGIHPLEGQGVHSYQDSSSAHENPPVRLMVGCSSSPDSPGEVRLHVMDPLPPILPTPPAITVQLRIATDESFTSYHPKGHLPLSFLQRRPAYVELSLLDPPDPNLVLLVHSCLAYTQDPHASWILVYDGCDQRVSQLLPSPNSHHIRKIKVSSSLFLPSESSPYTTRGGYPLFEDPEFYFMCLAEVCAAADEACTISCFKGPNSDV